MVDNHNSQGNAGGGNGKLKGTEIVRYADAHRSLPGQGFLAIGIIWCVLGGVATAFAPAVAAYMVAFGMTFVLGEHDARRPAFALLASTIAAFVACRMGNESFMLNALATVVAAYALSAFASQGKIDLTRWCGVTVALAAVLIASDASLAHAAGTDLPTLMGGAFDSSIAKMAAGNMEIAAQLRSMRDLMVLFWPMNYLLSAIATVAFGHVGTRFALRRLDGASDQSTPLCRFDMPLWPVWVLIAGIVALALSSTDIAGGDTLRFVGANLLMGIRLVFAFQGMAVIDGLLVRRNAGKGMRVLAGVLVLFLEMILAFASVIGLVDVWANFRRLPRGEDVPSDSAKV